MMAELIEMTWNGAAVSMGGHPKIWLNHFSHFSTHSTCKNPLQVLKGGLSKLKETIKKRKESLLQVLQLWEQKISSEDEDWLDQEANFVDEEAIVDMLENASDYERALSKQILMIPAHENSRPFLQALAIKYACRNRETWSQI